MTYLGESTNEGKGQETEKFVLKSKGTINGIIRFSSKEETNSKTKKKVKGSLCSKGQMGARNHGNKIDQRNLTCSEYPQLEQSQE